MEQSCLTNASARRRLGSKNAHERKSTSVAAGNGFAAAAICRSRARFNLGPLRFCSRPPAAHRVPHREFSAWRLVAYHRQYVVPLACRHHFGRYLGTHYLPSVLPAIGSHGHGVSCMVEPRQPGRHAWCLRSRRRVDGRILGSLSKNKDRNDLALRLWFSVLSFSRPGLLASSAMVIYRVVFRRDFRRFFRSRSALGTRRRFCLRRNRRRWTWLFRTRTCCQSSHRGKGRLDGGPCSGAGHRKGGSRKFGRGYFHSANAYGNQRGLNRRLRAALAALLAQERYPQLSPCDRQALPNALESTKCGRRVGGLRRIPELRRRAYASVHLARTLPGGGRAAEF